MQKKNQLGFTLIEILIALSIFAVIAVIGSLVLRHLLETHAHIQKKEARLREVMTAMAIVRHDITQMIARPVTDTSGSELPALLIPNRTQLEFTRTGYSNPLRANRSTMQRVAYVFSDHALYRKTWNILDRAPNSKENKRIILNGIRNLTWFFVNGKGQLIAVWSTATTSVEFPRAIIISMTLDEVGEVTQVLPIAGRGYGA